MTTTHPAESRTEADVRDLAAGVRAFAGLHAKSVIGLVSEVFGDTDWLSGPGDDGAAAAFDDSFVIACGEALLPSFVQHDPYGAGIAAVLTNVNDLAAMGARPLGIVDTVVADDDTARAILRGLRYGCDLYEVPLLGGHLTRYAGPPALSAFGVGRAEVPLSVTRVRAGHSIVLAAALDGELRTDFPFFRGFHLRETQAAGDVRLLADLAESGACAAAKDVSMAGLVGSLAMLLEQGRFGATVDLNAVPRPADVALDRWLTCFPSYAFLLSCAPDRVGDCRNAFAARGLAAEVIATVDDSGVVALAAGAHRAPVIDLRTESVTGLR